jgi:DNA (cytosine-5)-methyltransferase 1
MNVAPRADTCNLISLCTGGGGLDLGVELAMPRARCVVLVEREAFAVSHLVSAIQKGLMAPAAIWSDVTTFDGRPWRGLVDGVIGGVPCQPHSLAGKRLGEDDERDLWSDVRRIIVQSGVWFVLIENVSAMLSAKPGLDPGALRIRRDLQRLGFDVEGGLFTASEFGASHERKRVFILAVANASGERWRAQRPGRSGAACGWPHAEFAGQGIELANADSERLERIGADIGAQGRPDARGPSGLRDGATLVHAPGDRRRERRPEPKFRGWRDAVAGTDCAVVDTISRLHDGRPDVAIGRSIERTIVERPGEYVGLFPPGPSSLSSWAGILASAPELEPAFRRVAHGLATRLDVARVDRLRMLGNGVVPVQAAYAVRTLATRLAAGGSAGAARLIRMMMEEVP